VGILIEKSITKDQQALLPNKSNLGRTTTTGSCTMFRMRLTNRRSHKCQMVSIAWIVLAITSLFISTNTLAQNAQVLGVQPNCIADTFKSADVKRKLRLKHGKVNLKNKNNQLRKAINKLVKQATDKGFEAIVISNIKTKHPSEGHSGKLLSHQFIMEVSADFLTLCDNDKSLSSELTKYDAQGIPQFKMATGRKIKKTIVLDIGIEEVSKPELTSRVVSSAGEIYGLDLMNSSEQLINSFGTPSFVFTFNQNNKILAYGRTHWFYFTNDKLVKASTAESNTELFTYELINQIPYEERFDNLTWSVNDVMEKGYELAEGSQAGIENGTNASIKLHWSNYLNQAHRLVGYEISSSGMRGFDTSFNDQNENEAYDWVNNIIDGTIKPTDIIQASKGTILVDNRTKRYIYDSRLTFDIKRNKVTQIIIGDALYRTPSATSSKPWRLGDYHQSQTLDDAIAKTSQPMVEYIDEIDVNFDDYTLTLHAYDREIYKVEVKLF
jgi:hypothetical protein